MPWLRVRLSMSANRVDRLSHVLLEAGAQSLTLLDAGDVPVLEPGPGETPLWPQVEMAALFPLDTAVGALRTQLTGELGAQFERCELDVQFVADADWSQTWREFAIERCFGGRLWIVPRDAPLNESVTERGGVALRLDPGLAFGTGGHPSTAMCLEWLSLAPLDGASVVDYGAGSGVLGIAALLLGAANVIAVDHDPQARLATLDNATYNGVTAQRLSVVAPDELACTPRDLVLANILAGPLVTLASVLSALTRPGGMLVMSGMLAHQLDGVLRHYPEFQFAKPQLRESWVMVQGPRRVAEESLEPLITQCPTCKTRFRVSEAQLEVAAGRVRCGACLSVFAGHDHLVLASGARLQPDESANEALDALLEELRDKPPAPPTPVDAVVDATRPGAQGVDVRASADVLAGSNEAPDARATDIAKSVAPVEDADAHAASSPELATAMTRRERLRAARGTDAPIAGVSTAAAALELDPEELIKRPLRRRRRWWMPLALLLGVALLVGQVLYFQFDEWAKNPQFRPFYEWVCARVQCELPVMRSLAAIYSKNLVVRTHPDAPGMLMVDAVIVNQAPFPQPFPVIELRFSSLSGSLIAARRYRPEEYLAGELAGASMMAALTPIHIAFQISDPGNDAVNYVLVFR